MKSFQEMNRKRIGVVGILVIALVVTLGLESGTIVSSLTSSDYQAAFSEAGNLASGDKVEVSGVNVGKVTGVDLKNGQVQVSFNVHHGVHLGGGTRAAIATESPLGHKFLGLTSAGQGALAAGSEIPLSRTTAPYDIQQVLNDTTDTLGQIDTKQLAKAFDTTAQTFQNTPAQMRSALKGVTALSATIASRDQALRDLLTKAKGVTGVLAQRTDNLNALFDDGNLLLNELYQRRQDIQSLLVNATSMVRQLRGLATDNQQKIGPALQHLDSVVQLLNRNKGNIDSAITGLKSYATGLGEAVGSGPFFYGYIQNIVPTNAFPIVQNLLAGGTKPPAGSSSSGTGSSGGSAK
jgi:phospholipid/cholesterol/gamma-HCH transport system substrate-binding protein